MRTRNQWETVVKLASLGSVRREKENQNHGHWRVRSSAGLYVCATPRERLCIVTAGTRVHTCTDTRVCYSHVIVQCSHAMEHGTPGTLCHTRFECGSSRRPHVGGIMVLQYGHIAIILYIPAVSAATKTVLL